jgi:hypothetical protein
LALAALRLENVLPLEDDDLPITVGPTVPFWDPRITQAMITEGLVIMSDEQRRWRKVTHGHRRDIWKERGRPVDRERLAACASRFTIPKEVYRLAHEAELEVERTAMEDKVYGIEEAEAALAAQTLGPTVHVAAPGVPEEEAVEIALRRSLEGGQVEVPPGTHDEEAGPSGTAGETEPEEAAELLLSVSRGEPVAMVAAPPRAASPVATVAVAGVVVPPGPFSPHISPGLDDSGIGAFAEEVLAASQPVATTEVPVAAIGAEAPQPVRVPFGPAQPTLRAMPPPPSFQLAGEAVDPRATLDMVLRMGLYLRAERRRLDGRAAADEAFAAIGRLLDAYEDNDYRLDGELEQPSGH